MSLKDFQNIKIDFKKDGLPHLIAIIGFLVISFAYFFPQLQSQTLAQHDVIQYEGMSKEVREFREETGENPLWTTSMFAGMPSYQISLEYPNRLWGMEYLYQAIVSPFERPANFLFTYLLSFYIMMLCFKVGPIFSFIGAVAFAFSAHNIIIIEAGHNTKADAIGLAPLVIGAVYASFRTSYWLVFAALAAMFVGFQVRANHPQITYYLIFIIGALGIGELIRAYYNQYTSQFLKTAGVLLIGAFLGAGAVVTNLLITWEYGEETIRGPSDLEQNDGDGGGGSGLDYDYATRWSLGIDETLTLLIPNFKGGSSEYKLTEDMETYQQLEAMGAGQQTQSFPMYWGSQPMTSGPMYMGAIVIFLFICALFWVKGPIKWAILVVTILAIMLSWGNNFDPLTELFFYNFPLYDRFRAVTMILFIPTVTLPLLGILGLWKAVNHQLTQEDFWKGIKYGGGITGGICLIFALFPGVFYNFQGPNDGRLPEQLLSSVINDRQSMMQMDAWRSLFFIAVAAAALYLWNIGKIKRNLTLGIIGAAILIDLWVVDRRFLSSEDFSDGNELEQTFAATPADERILEDDDPNFRVLNLTVSPFNDATTSYHHKSVGGYHGAKLGRYQDLIDHHLGNEVQQLRQQLQQQQGQFGRLDDFDMLNMLNTRYLIAGERWDAVVENPNALGNAWFVEDIHWAETARDAMNTLGNIDPASETVIEEEFRDIVGEIDPSPSPGDEIELTDFKPHYLEFEASVNSPQVAVISEVYYNEEKGWSAYINGEDVDHFRLNYTLRGLKIPEGEHTIEFKFEPDTYYLGERISLASSLILIFFVLGGIIYQFRLYKFLTNKPE